MNNVPNGLRLIVTIVDRKKGKKVYYLADAELIHLHRQESTKKLSKMTMIHLKSMSKFYYKYYFNKFDFK